MTTNHLNRIETALEIRLPVVYRELVGPFPIPAYEGNTETELWDDADTSIELNRELRAGYCSSAPWPVHMFAIGRDDSGCARAIDLRDPMGPVWWADRCHLDAVGTALESPSLAAWAEQHLADLWIDLEERGVAEAGPPPARAEDGIARAECTFALAIVGIGTSLVFAAWLAVRWLAP